MPKQTLWILWGSLTASILVYVGIAVFMRTTAGPVAINPMLPQLVPVFGALALGQGVLSFALRPMLAKGDIGPYFLVRWAMLDGVAALGLVLYFLGADLNVVYAFAGVAFAVMCLNAPNQEQIQRYIDLHGKQP